MFRRLRFVIALFFVVPLSKAQTANDTLALLDAVFEKYTAADPGCQVSVLKGGKIYYSKAFGLADLERNVPLTTSALIEAGSVSKQFTAAAILLLEQEGKLSLNDDVRKYVSELPDYGNPIRIKDLLHHTSGLKDWGSLFALTGWGRGSKFYTNEDALDIIARQKSLNNKPGDEFVYSNSNYVLCAIIVQRLSGLSLAEYTQKYIFEPAGMQNTQWRDDPNRIVNNRAIAYAFSDKKYVTDMPNEYVYGAGGLLTTTEDLLKWSAFYQSGKMGTSSLFARQIETEKCNNGEKNTYAAGLNIDEVLGQKSINHTGATAGYRAILETFPDLKLTIAVLSNNSRFSLVSAEDQVRKLFIGNKSKKETERRPEKTVVLNSETLEKVAGFYRFDSDGQTFHLVVKDKSLQLLEQKQPLQSYSATRFAYDYGEFNIEGDKGMFLVYPTNVLMPFSRATDFKADPKELDVYQGKFFSTETNSNMLISKKNDKLECRLSPNAVYAMTVSDKDKFKTEDLGATLQFLRDASGHIAGIKVSVDRAKNLLFTKTSN